ncbi:MAG: hypothetical protein QOJ33_2051 [Chloroflexota bacterium]|nr:hypothetical protein [Chloroflexota bacterium]
MKLGVGALASLLVLAACGNPGTAVTSTPTPSEVATPTPSESPSALPSITPSPLPPASPVPIPSWAVMKATCTGQSAAREAILVMKAAPAVKVLADVTDPLHPKTICKLSGGWSPVLVTDSEISWAASEHRPGTAGASVIATLDVFSGTASVVATWQGGGYLDGLHAWSPHRDLLAYLVSDTSGVDLHLLSGGGDRVVASLGVVPGRGVSVTEDDAFLQFSPDGAFFALEQTFASGSKLQIRRATNGALAYSQASATMATWGSTGSKLYFRHQGSGTIYAWDSVAGLTQPIGQSLLWVKPQADAGDDYLAFTVRDATGAPHVWLYGHGGRSGTQLPNVRSSPQFLTASQVFYISETPCGVNCGPGPATLPDGKTFIYDISHQLEVASTIMTVYTTWPKPGQI